MPDFLERKNMAPSCSRHHDHRDISLGFKTILKPNVAPGMAASDDPRSIAKGLTSKLAELLSKTREAT